MYSLIHRYRLFIETSRLTLIFFISGEWWSVCTLCLLSRWIGKGDFSSKLCITCTIIEGFRKFGECRIILVFLTRGYLDAISYLYQTPSSLNFHEMSIFANYSFKYLIRRPTIHRKFNKYLRIFWDFRKVRNIKQIWVVIINDSDWPRMLRKNTVDRVDSF